MGFGILGFVFYKAKFQDFVMINLSILRYLPSYTQRRNTKPKFVTMSDDIVVNADTKISGV